MVLGNTGIHGFTVIMQLMISEKRGQLEQSGLPLSDTQ